MEDKKSYALPFIALLLCMTLIVGATFALFTSKKTIKIAVNAAEVNLDAFIKADSLKTYSLDVEQFDNEADVGYFELGGSAALTTVDEVPTLTISEMAPGDKAELTVGIKNKSTIDIMWRVKWEIKGELADALVVTADGKAAASTMYTKWISSEDIETVIAVELPYGTENEYQGKTADIVFTIEAIQGNGPIEWLATVETFNAVLGEARNGDTITLVNEEGGAVNTSGTPITINKVDVAAGATYTVAGNPTIG